MEGKELYPGDPLTCGNCLSKFNRARSSFFHQRLTNILHSQKAYNPFAHTEPAALFLAPFAVDSDIFKSQAKPIERHMAAVTFHGCLLNSCFKHSLLLCDDSRSGRDSKAARRQNTNRAASATKFQCSTATGSMKVFCYWIIVKETFWD